MIDINTPYLTHSGIKGQKWGQRRFQNPDGSLTAEGRARYGVGEARSKHAANGSAGKKSVKTKKENFVKQAIAKNKAAKEAKKAQAEAEKEAKKAKAEAEQHENMMKYLRQHPTQAYKHRTELTNDDANRLISEIAFDRKLKDIRDAEIKRTWDKINSFSNKVGTIANLTNNSINAWDNTAMIYNKLADNGVIKSDKRMPRIR